MLIAAAGRAVANPLRVLLTQVDVDRLGVASLD
jgi:hypothetical protein